MSQNITTARQGRRRSASVVLAGAVASAAIAMSFTPTYSAFVASIKNSANTLGTGTLTMQETNADGSIVCNSTDGGSISTNSATCATINKYGGNMAMVPGQTVSTDIKIKNTGTVTATSFTLTPGACTQSNNGAANGTATNLCSKINVVIKSGSTTIYSGTAAALTNVINFPASLVPVAPGATVPLTISTTVDSSADSTYQGLSASQPLTWTFTS